MSIITQTEFQEQMQGVIAEIYAHDNLTAQSIPNGASYTKVINFTANGVSQNATADFANNKVTLTKKGIYSIACSISFAGGANNINWFPVIFINGVEQNNIHFQRKIGVVNDFGSSQMEGAGEILVGDLPVDVDLRIRHDDTVPDDLTAKYVNLKVTRVGLGV